MSIPGMIFFPDFCDFTVNPVGSDETLMTDRSFAGLLAASNMATNPTTAIKRMGTRIRPNCWAFQ
jgi:hypothetical protein